jgi:hypothetical protein
MKSKFLAISLSLTFGLSVFSQEIQLEDVPEPNAISVKDIRKVAIAEFKCEQCFPEEALERLVEIIEKKTGKRLIIRIQEKDNPQNLHSRILLHRKISLNLTDTNAHEVLFGLISKLLWHWELESEHIIIIKAWHQPQTD